MIVTRLAAGPAQGIGELGAYQEPKLKGVKLKLELKFYLPRALFLLEPTLIGYLRFIKYMLVNR